MFFSLYKHNQETVFLKIRQTSKEKNRRKLGKQATEGFLARSHSGNAVPGSVIPRLVVPGLVVPGSVVPGSVGVPDFQKSASCTITVIP
jgi:hypothetical protein